MKIEKCPFCGGEAIPCSTGNHFATEKFFVSCGVCGVETPRIARTRKEAIAAWNRRVDARQLALKTRVCPMCEDCPDGCPVETPKDSRNIVTNADRIRKTTDEELAKMLAYNDVFYEEICGSDERTRVCDNDCVACTLEWLRQRAKEEHHENY